MLRLRGLRGSLRGELNERLAACQAASRALGVVPGGAGWRGEKSAFKILLLTLDECVDKGGRNLSDAVYEVGGHLAVLAHSVYMPPAPR